MRRAAHMLICCGLRPTDCSMARKSGCSMKPRVSGLSASRPMKSAPNRPLPPGGGAAEALLACSRPCRMPALAGSSCRPARVPSRQQGMQPLPVQRRPDTLGSSTRVSSQQRRRRPRVLLQTLAHACVGGVQPQPCMKVQHISKGAHVAQQATPLRLCPCVCRPCDGPTEACLACTVPATANCSSRSCSLC